MGLVWLLGCGWWGTAFFRVSRRLRLPWGGCGWREPSWQKRAFTTLPPHGGLQRFDRLLLKRRAERVGPALGQVAQLLEVFGDAYSDLVDSP